MTPPSQVVPVPDAAVEAVARHLAANDGHGHWHLVETKGPYLRAAEALLQHAAPHYQQAVEEAVAARLLSYLDSLTDDPESNGDYLDGWADCREDVEQFFALPSTTKGDGDGR